MGEQSEDLTGDVVMNSSEMAFDNLIILKEFSNIANLVRDEDFLETVPKAKLRRVKWVPMFNCLKQGIMDEMMSEIGAMWQYENMHQKLDLLEKQKEKYSDGSINKTEWRPQLGDVKSQLKGHDVANLQKQKKLLESLATEYEMRVNRLKKTLLAKRGYLKAFQMDIHKYQKKNEDLITKINDRIENHSYYVKDIIPSRKNIDEISWTDKDLGGQI